jgi:uncharacterized membrane protein
MRKFFKNQITFLLFGLVFWLPVAIVLYILFLLFSNVENIGQVILSTILPENLVHPGYGIILFILIVYFSGVLLKSTKVGGILSKIPVIGLFFGQGEVITISRLLNMQPCLFLLSPTCISYGWILSDEKVQLGEEKAGFSLLSVYYPNVPTMVTGSVFAIRKDTIIKLGNTSKEVLDLLLYSFRSPASLKYLPWEDESREEFEARSKFFGLIEPGENWSRPIPRYAVEAGKKS